MTVEMKNQPSQWRHYLASFDAHTQESYLMFLAAIAFEDNVLSENERRYLQDLANAISDISIDSLIVQLPTVDAAWIDQFLQILNQKHLGLLFFVDAVLMFMSAAGIGERESILLGNLSNALQLPDDVAHFAVNIAIALIKNDQSLFRKCLDSIDPDYDLDAVYLSYLEARMDDKLSFERDVSNTNILTGNYIIYKPIHINHDLTLKDCRLQFAKYGSIIIESQGKLVLENCQITEGNLICESKASLIVDKLDFLGGKGISTSKKTVLEIKHSKFYGTGIVASHAKELSITNTEFHNSHAKPFLDLNECLDVELNGCAFTNDPPGGPKVRVPIAGAIKAHNSGIYIRNSSFTNCRSSEDGGAMNLNSCVFGIDNCKFSHCHSNKSGGAIAISGKRFDDENLIETKSANLKAFLNGVKPITVDGRETFTIFDDKYYLGSEPQPLISKSRFIDCSSAISGGAILDTTDSLRVINSDFKDNDAKEKPGDLAIIGMFHLTNYGTHLTFGGPNYSDKTLINDSLDNNSGVKIVKCNFSSESPKNLPGVFLTRVYNILFMTGCTFNNRNISVEYGNDITYEKTGFLHSDIEWPNILYDIEKEFYGIIRLYNRFVLSGVASPKKDGKDELDYFDFAWEFLAGDQVANYVSFNRQHLPSAFKTKS
jgi:hypothetical protein